MSLNAQHVVTPATASSNLATRIMSGDQSVQNGSLSFDSMVSRAYQLEMFEKSKEENIIVCMETGSGKTQIARLRIDFELQRSPGSWCWFLAQTQVLAEQQHTFLTGQLPSYSFRLITGAHNVEYWTSQKIWEAALASQNGIVSTPAVLHDALCHGFVSFDKISLLVFDEAHHCVKNNPYNKIMNLLKQHSAEGKAVPHILGLTATPMIRDDLKLISELENNLTAVCKTPTRSVEEFRGFVHLPKLIWLPFEVTVGQGSILLRQLEQVLREYRLNDDPTIIRLQQSTDPHDQQKLANCLRKDQSPTKNQILDLFRKSEHIEQIIGPWAADHHIYECISKLVERTANQQDCLFVIEFVETVHLAKLLRPLLEVTISSLPKGDEVTPKVNALFSYLRSVQAEGITGVIFVQRRTVAYALHNLLVRASGLDGFHPFTFVGCSNPLSRTIADLTDLRVQQRAFADFRKGTRNLAIATQVLEEGIDVRACNLVLSFDPPASSGAYIQRRGRARHPDANFVFMVDGHAPSTKVLPWQSIEEEMNRMCAEENRIIEELVQDQDLADKDFELDPVRASDAIVDIDSALQHLEYFCQTMPKDSGRPPRPLYLVRKNEFNEYSCEVVLPYGLSPDIRKISSIHCWRTEKASRKDAALGAYRAVSRAGLLNRHLLPVHAEGRKHGEQYEPIESRQAVLSVQPCLDIWSRCRAALNAKEPLFSYQVIIDGQVEALLLLPIESREIESTIRSIEGYEVSIKVLPQTTDVGEVHSVASAITMHLYRSVLQRRLQSFVEESHGLSHYVIPNIPPQEWPDWLKAGQKRIPLVEYQVGTDSEVLLYAKGQPTPYFWDPTTTSLPLRESVLATKLSRTIGFSTKDSQLSQAPLLRELPVADCFVSMLEPRYARAMVYMPTILHEVESALRSQAALASTQLRKIEFDLTQTRSAFVAPMASKVNYQRLEFIGDALLKYLASINVFCNNPLYHEGALTSKATQLINNARLHRSALVSGLDPFLTTERFSGKDWTLVPRAPVERKVSSKTLADMVEAILGAAYQPRDGTGLRKVIEALKIFLPEATWLPPDEDVARVRIADLTFSVDRQRLQIVENLVGYRFRHPILLAEALNHSSPYMPLFSYQRLEFLGDAIIDLIVKEALFDSQQQLSEESMTRARHALVNKETFAFLTTQAAVSIEHAAIAVQLRSKDTTVESQVKHMRLHDLMFRTPSADLSLQRSDLLLHYDEVAEDIAAALKTGKMWPWADLLHLNSPKWA